MRNLHAIYYVRRGRLIVYSALSASSLYETHNNVKVDQKAKPHIEKEEEAKKYANDLCHI